MQIDDLYHHMRLVPSDISEHLELLSRLASLCRHVTEFGVRDGISTAALLHGRPERLASYDLSPCSSQASLEAAAAEAAISFSFHQADVLGVDIEPTDFLFIDTWHTYAQMQAELARHAGKVRRFLVFHDTTTFGDQGEDGGQGIWPAIAEFCRAQPHWGLLSCTSNCHGLTVLRHAVA